MIRKMKIPGGKAGTLKTLKLMGKLAARYKSAPAIYQLSRDLVRHLPPKDERSEINALYQFVRDRIRYVKDVKHVETLQTPNQTLKIGQGDCDDKSTLLAALALSIGYAVKFVVVGEGGNFYHVFPEILIYGEWVPADACEPLPLGHLKKQLPERGEYLL